MYLVTTKILIDQTLITVQLCKFFNLTKFPLPQLLQSLLLSVWKLILSSAKSPALCFPSKHPSTFLF